MLGLFVVIFFVGILLLTRLYPEAAILLPAPLLVALAESGYLPLWVKPMLYIIAGTLLAIVILALFNQRR